MTSLTMVVGDKIIPVSISVGVATAGLAELGLTEFIQRADDALYQSKREGRDRCTSARVSDPVVAAPGPEAIGPPRNQFPDR
jgi:PleD family two-component response regulator